LSLNTNHFQVGVEVLHFWTFFETLVRGYIIYFFS